MNLQNITSTCCPVCGCSVIVKESVEYNENDGIRIHCNGGRWEHRYFLCGGEIYFVPNFNKEIPRGTCKNDPKYLAKIQKQKEDEEKLTAFCEENSIDSEVFRKIKDRMLWGGE